MAKNVAVVVIVVFIEQAISVRLVVEELSETAHHLFEVIAVVYDFSCEVFLTVVLSDVAVLEVFEFFTVPFDECVHSVRRILLAQVAVFSHSLEAVLVEARFVEAFLGEALVVLCHQFRIFLVSVDCVAEVEKVVVVLERGEVNPQTANAFLTAVFAVCVPVKPQNND